MRSNGLNVLHGGGEIVTGTAKVFGEVSEPCVPASSGWKAGELVPGWFVLPV